MAAQESQRSPQGKGSLARRHVNKQRQDPNKPITQLYQCQMAKKYMILQCGGTLSWKRAEMCTWKWPGKGSCM